MGVVQGSIPCKSNIWRYILFVIARSQDVSTCTRRTNMPTFLVAQRSCPSFKYAVSLFITGIGCIIFDGNMQKVSYFFIKNNVGYNRVTFTTEWRAPKSHQKANIWQLIISTTTR
jgi:hypothetical protein